MSSDWPVLTLRVGDLSAGIDIGVSASNRVLTPTGRPALSLEAVIRLSAFLAVTIPVRSDEGASLADNTGPMHVTQSAHLDDHSAGLTGHALRHTASTYVQALLALATALLVQHVLSPWSTAPLPFVTVFGAVATAAWLGGYAPAVLVTGLGYVSSGWLLGPGALLPVGATELGSWPGLVVYLLTCGVIVGIAEATRRSHLADGEAATMLRAALRNVGEAVVTADMDACVTSMNPVAELLTGWREADAMGQPLDVVVRLIDASTRAPLGSPAAVGLQEDCVIVGVARRTVLVSRHGAERDVDENTTPLRDARGRRVGVAMILADTTESRRQERERQAQSRELRRRGAIVESSIDAIIATGIDGRIATWNAAATRLFGYDDAVGKDMALIVPPESLAEETQILGSVVAGCRIEHYETERMRADGQRIIVSLSIAPIRNERGQVTGASMIARDVSRQRRADQRDRDRFAQAIAERDRLQDELQRLIGDPPEPDSRP